MRRLVLGRKVKGWRMQMAHVVDGACRLWRMSFAAGSATRAKHGPAGRHEVVAGALSQCALAVIVLAKHLVGGRQVRSSAFAVFCLCQCAC